MVSVVRDSGGSVQNGIAGGFRKNEGSFWENAGNMSCMERPAKGSNF